MCMYVNVSVGGCVFWAEGVCVHCVTNLTNVGLPGGFGPGKSAGSVRHSGGH